MENNTTQTETETASRYSAEERTEIARTIIQQINALDFWARARWGWKESLALGPDTVGVQFNCNKKIKIRIVLDASDTYSIEIGRLKGRFDYVKHVELSDIYAEDLVRIIDGAFSQAFGSL
jgi:hypothetical protein